MKVNLPPVPDRYDSSYFTRAFASLDRTLEFGVSRTEAVQGVMLLSPGGLVYKVTVEDDGTLTTTSVPLGQSGATRF